MDTSADPSPLIAWFDDLRADDVPRVGGKNASLGEMVSQLATAGIPVPPGFATTAAAYWATIDGSELRATLAAELDAFHANTRSLAEVGAAIRRAIREAPLPDALRAAITAAYRALGERVGDPTPTVAVRSSATAEDLPEASFAGQQETFLNIRGEAEVLAACQACYASLFTDRAITYREANGFDHLKVALSIGIQAMARSDRGAAGVIFTLDTETGFADVVMINAAWGLGENVVKGEVNPDEYYVHKPGLADPALRPILRKRLGAKEKTMVFASGGSQTTRNLDTPQGKRDRFALEDNDILTLARWAALIERHYSERAGKPTPMDIEWAKDGVSGKLYILQARPETVQSRRRGAAEMVSYVLEDRAEPIVLGRSVGGAIVSGEVCVIRHPDEIDRFRPGSILVAEITDPDWVPIMRQAAGIITDHGGRTCHAAIVSRELGIPAVVGTGDATTRLGDGDTVTLSCAEGEVGKIYAGALRFRRETIDLHDLPATRTKIMLNLADPGSALRHWRLPVDGIGLARMEFIITEDVQVHPMALAHPERVSEPEARAAIDALTRAYPSPTEYFVETLGRGIGMLAASVYPRPAIVRMSDFKTNEYARLLGGADFEHHEENPMIGFRGASRYYSERYRDGFALECRAIRYVREVLGLTNVVVMIPFCRTLGEADRVLEVMAAEGLRRGEGPGEGGLRVYVMCEIPSNVILAREFSARFDGFSIGSNDLTQLVLGTDRDSELLAHIYDERDPAVVSMIQQVIREAHGAGRPVGICGQAPSDHPDFAEMLVEAGIDSISLNPDSVLGVRRRVADLEARLAAGAKSHAS
ncbi:MAG: phosphoenolpyruvate synthase [Myxococcales bacterium]|nr:phosphoenolpyruvate synthase [Myxococcales bacterium]